MKKLLSLLLFSGAVLPVLAGALEIGFDKGTNPGWGFFIGMEAPGAQGNLVMMPEKVGIPALPAARLEGAFNNGGWYVGMSRNLEKPVPFGKLTIKLASWDYNAIVVRLVDSSGQTHQMLIWLRSGGEWKEGVWKEFVIKRPKLSPHYWGGANDGKWHGNLKSVMILVEGVGLMDRKKGQGFLYFNRIAIEAPEA